MAYLNNEIYISTEDTLHRQVGLTLATPLPNTLKTQSFSTDEVLISNIRLYFKKYQKIDTTLQYLMVKHSNVKTVHRKYIG